MRTVVGLFDQFEHAQMAVRDLKSAGFSGDDISLIARDSKGDFQRHFSTETGHDVETENVGDGTAKGAGIGAVLGGIGGFLVGLGLLAIPGVGPVLAAGPIAAALAGAGMGAVAGGLIGALADMGIPDDHAELYAEGVRRGGSLVVVRAQDDMADRAVSILNSHNPVDVERRSQDWRSQNWTGFDANAEPYESERLESEVPVTGTQTMDMDRTTDRTYDRDHDRDMDRTHDKDHATIPVIHEDLHVGKREVETGGVEINTRVNEVPVEEEVRLRREQVNVERRPVDRPASDKDFDQFKEGTMEFRETEEQAMVQKTARVVEEIHVDKNVEENVEQIRDTVRRTDVDVRHTNENREGMGMSGTTGSVSSSADWNHYDTAFRRHFMTSYGSTGRDYSYYMPAYQYGYTIANDSRYQGRDWDRLEMDARRDWESNHRDSLWDDVRDAVRHAWESVRRAV